MRSLLVSLILALTVRGFAGEPPEPINWQPWSDAVFEQAKKEHKFVFLDLGAGWCHWCHVMDEITYQDPEVRHLLQWKYIAVRVDQDARPDLSNRYEDYGWPATVVFDSDGSEIVKRQGYIPPKPMARLLQAIIDDPSPGPSVRPEAALNPAQTGSLSSAQRTAMRKTLVTNYDNKKKGWGTIHKYIDPDIIEYSMGETDPAWEKRARETLTAGRKLIDPVWGGIYQYSTDGDWVHPHFEKIMSFQAEDLRTYANAYARWKEPADLRAAEQLRHFMETFLSSPEGAFYPSQDADVVRGEHSGKYFALNDAQRRAQGIPRVDPHLYARENGWAINALAAFYASTGDRSALDRALRAAEWVLAHRAAEGGGFRHDEKDSAGPYLGDNIAMARAFLGLYATTADRKWLPRAQETMRYIDQTFKAAAGYQTAASRGALPVRPQLDENVAIARTANLLQHYTGGADYRGIAEHAMRFLAAKGYAENRGLLVGGILLADRELAAPPLHITVVGAKSDPAAQALHSAALALPAPYKRVEWLDRNEGPLPNADVEYLPGEQAAAYLCTNNACSAPITDPTKLKLPKRR
jgi:uncharacterized protein YyaL (SSP411 family)